MMKNKNVKHWFYSPKVKEHFFKPKNILTDREVLKYKADGVGVVGSPKCGDVMKMWIKVNKKTDTIKECRWQCFGSLVRGTKLLMNNFSTKKVEELQLGEEIFDGGGKKNFIEEVLVRDYNGKIVSIQLSTSRYYNFKVTPNHPIPSITRKKVAKINRLSGNRFSEFSEKKLNGAFVELTPAFELKRGDFMIFNVPQMVKDDSKLDKDICTLLGYYVSDGHISSKNNIIFYFGLNEIPFVNEIKKIAIKKGFNYKIYKRNTENVLCIQLNEPNLVSLLLKHGGKAGLKKFSNEVLFLPSTKQECIINAYLKGDGWVQQQGGNRQPQYFISTSKEELAYQLQLMIGRLGIFAPIHKRESRKFIKNGKIYQNSGEFNIIFRKGIKHSRIKFYKKERTFLIPISKISVLHYKGKIYDPGLVYEPKTYRVNGISLHNCASAIATTSILSAMVKGMKLDKAVKIMPMDIVKNLGGLPANKIHCSVLGDKALRAAINDYFRKTSQLKRIIRG